MSSLGVALPLELSSIDGFEMIKTIKKLVRQNLKMLILTNPGERVMAPNFGVGIKRFLFANQNSNVRSQITAKIQEQAQIYLPAVEITDIYFQDNDEDFDANILSMSIEYRLPSINEADLLRITI